MWRPYLVTGNAQAFDAALGGQPTGESAEAIARFVRELSAAAGFAQVDPSERGRTRLLAAVAARREERKYRAVAPLPVRGGSIIAATVAGGGLLVAAAANATDPLAFVKQAVNEVASAVHIPQVFGEPDLAPVGAAHEVVIVGEIAAFADGEPSFVVDTDGVLEHVRLRADTVLRYDDGTPVGRVAHGVGARVRVRGVRSGNGPIDALVVELPARAPAATPTGGAAAADSPEPGPAADRPPPGMAQVGPHGSPGARPITSTPAGGVKRNRSAASG